MTRRRLFGLSLAPLFAPLLAWLPKRETVTVPEGYTVLLRGFEVVSNGKERHFGRVLFESEWLPVPVGVGRPLEPDGRAYAINGDEMLRFAFENHVAPYAPEPFEGIGQWNETGWLVERPA